MNEDVTLETSAGGVIPVLRDGRVCVPMITAMGGRVSFPKGHLEAGETPEEAAAREVREETGLVRPRVMGKLGVLTREKAGSDGRTKRKDVHIFLMTAEGVVFDHEDDFVWLPLEDAVGLMQREEESELLRQHESEIRKAAIAAFPELEQSRAWDAIYSAPPDEGVTVTSPVEVSDGSAVLQIGVSDGLGLAAMLEKQAISALAVDVSQTALESARRLCVSRKIRGTFAVLAKDAHDILSGDLPSRIDLLIARGSLNLSDTKVFFLLNEVVRNMPVGGRIVIEGESAASADALGLRTVGKHLGLTKDGRLIRVWDDAFVDEMLVSRLRLQREPFDFGSGRFVCVLRKVEDYAY